MLRDKFGLANTATRGLLINRLDPEVISMLGAANQPPLVSPQPDYDRPFATSGTFTIYEDTMGCMWRVSATDWREIIAPAMIILNQLEENSPPTSTPGDNPSSASDDNSPATPDDSKRMKIAIGAGVGGGLVFLSIIGFLGWKIYRKRKELSMEEYYLPSETSGTLGGISMKENIGGISSEHAGSQPTNQLQRV